MEDTTTTNSAAWLDRVRAGDFRAIPNPLPWNAAVPFSQAVGNLYRHASALGLKPRDLYEERLAEARRTGQWRGSATELWVALWYSHRVAMMGLGQSAQADIENLDRLCAQLRNQLQDLCPHERMVLTRLLHAGW